MATVRVTDTGNAISARQAMRIVDRLRYTAIAHQQTLLTVLRDLPDADIAVIRGVLQMTKERARTYGRRSIV